AEACDVAFGPIEARHKSLFDRVLANREDNGNSLGLRSCRQHGWRTMGENHGHPTADQVGCQRRQSIELTVRPTILDRHIEAIDIAGFFQALPQSGYLRGEAAGGSKAEKADYRQRRLLRARRERPDRRRPTEQRDERAALHAHSITSSATNRMSRLI